MEPKTAMEQAKIDLIRAAAAESKDYMEHYSRELTDVTKKAMEASHFIHLVNDALASIKNVADMQAPKIWQGDPIDPEAWI